MPAALSIPTSNLREWTTERVPARERLDYWVGAICEAFLEMDCSSRAAPCFDGRLKHLPLGPLAANQVLASTQDVYRTPAGIARSRSQPFYLITQTDHAWYIRQGGHELYLRPGDAVLVDAAQAYELHFAQRVACLSVQMPRAWVGQWLRTVDVGHARVVHREQGWGAMLSALCVQLGRQPELALQMPPSWMEAQLGALLTASLEPSAVGQAAAPGRSLHQLALQYMRQRLDQPGWRVADLALELGVSARTLHRAFSQAGETVAGRWRQLRVERARDLLGQARFADLSMAAIGLRCGYSDASHFARDFQRVCGQSPLRWARGQRSDEP